MNFDPYYSSTIDGQVVTGAIILPNQAGFANINPGFVQSLAPIPLITAAQAGVPTNLRQTSKRDFAPRVGFAYRVGGSNKTVIRGGYGRFIESLLSGTAIDGWSVGSSDVGYFTNQLGAMERPRISFLTRSLRTLPNPARSTSTWPPKFTTRIPSSRNGTSRWSGNSERAWAYESPTTATMPTTSDVDKRRSAANQYFGFSDPATQAVIPFPIMAYIATNNNQGFGNYQGRDSFGQKSVPPTCNSRSAIPSRATSPT